MAKNCDLCGKDASFLAGGGSLYGKALCFECYNKAADASEEELKAMGIDGRMLGNQAYAGQGYIDVLRVLAWIVLVGFFILSIMTWANGGSFPTGLMTVLVGAVIFAVLHVLAIIAENVIAIRMNLESTNKNKD